MDFGREAVEPAEAALRQRHLFVQAGLEIRELLLGRKPPIPEQVDDLLEGRVRGQVFDRVAAVGECRTHDRADGGRTGHHTLKTAINRARVLRCLFRHRDSSSYALAFARTASRIARAAMRAISSS